MFQIYHQEILIKKIFTHFLFLPHLHEADFHTQFRLLYTEIKIAYSTYWYHFKEKLFCINKYKTKI